MNRLTKKQLIIGGLILLFVINLAALGTIIYQNYKDQRPQAPFLDKRERNQQFNPHDERKNRNRPDMDSRFPHGKGFDYYMREKLKLNDSQFQTFKRLKRENVQEIRKIVDSLQAKRYEMTVELSKPKPDEEKLHQIASEIGIMHRNLKLSTINYFVNLRKELSPEQMEYFNDMIQKMPGSGEHHMKSRNHEEKGCTLSD